MKLVRRFIFPLLIFIGLLIFFSKLTDLAELINLLKHGLWYAIVLAICLSAAIIYFQAELISSLYKLFGIKEHLFHLIPVMVASNFANLILPSAGFSGVTLFVADAKTRQIETSKALTVSLLYYFCYYLLFGLILLIGLIFLISTTGLSLYEILTAVIFFIIISLFTSFLWQTAHSAKRSIKILTLLVSFANTPYRWLKRRSLLPQVQINELAVGMFSDLALIRKGTKTLAKPLLYSLTVHASSILMLGYLFVAFNQPIEIPIILAGFSMAVLFSLVSITPGGIGFVEGIMVLTFRSLGVPVEIAIIVTFIYRGLTFWLPFIFGIMALRRLHLNQIETT